MDYWLIDIYIYIWYSYPYITMTILRETPKSHGPYFQLGHAFLRCSRCWKQPKVLICNLNDRNFGCAILSFGRLPLDTGHLDSEDVWGDCVSFGNTISLENHPCKNAESDFIICKLAMLQLAKSKKDNKKTGESVSPTPPEKTLELQVRPWWDGWSRFSSRCLSWMEGIGKPELHQLCRNFAEYNYTCRLN